MNPMKFVTHDRKAYTYECKIHLDELKNGVSYKIKLMYYFFPYDKLIKFN